jgi:hypothetical protein
LKRGWERERGVEEGCRGLEWQAKLIPDKVKAAKRHPRDRGGPGLSIAYLGAKVALPAGKMAKGWRASLYRTTGRAHHKA